MCYTGLCRYENLGGDCTLFLVLKLNEYPQDAYCILTEKELTMGIYDTYEDVQIKVGDVCCRTFSIGDTVYIPDGIYCGHEGFIVVKDGIFIAKFPVLLSKWGHIYYPDSILD